MKRLNLIIIIQYTMMLFVSCTSSGDIPSSEQWVVPNAGRSSGVIYGELINATSKKPVGGIPFLSRNLSGSDPELPATISFSYQFDPRAEVNYQTGEIYFNEVEPGENYVIMLYYGPGKSYVIRDEDGEYPLMISVNSGESVNLGTIFVPEP